MSDHVLEVPLDGEGFTIECLAGNGCNGWIECREPHTVGKLDATEGPYDCDPDMPWSDEEEWEFHGVLHEWRWGYGWTVPYPGCVVAAQGCDAPDDLWEVVDGEHRLKPGRWLVDDDWDDTDCYLTLVGPSPEVQP